jgi:ATP-dependent RNA/DNA helicase IGHMBP2
MDYFKRLSDLLRTEEQADRLAYRQLTESSSLAARRANGLSWYPIVIRDTEMGIGDYLTVELERTNNFEVAHLFRFGASVELFSNRDPKENRVEGVITYQGGNKIKISLRTDELPDWSRDGQLGLNLLFDDNTYDEMKAAIREAGRRLDKREDDLLIRILTGDKQPTFYDDQPQFESARLNPSQTGAVRKILAANELAIVHGPPGTGKTTTLVEAIKALYAQTNQQLLVVAPSNAAVDLLSEKLSDNGMNVVRVGNPARVSEKLFSLTVDQQMAEHSQMKQVKKLKKRANEFREMAYKYKRNFGKAERDQRKSLFEEARNILKEAGNTEQYILNDLLSKAQVIAATLVGANHYTIRDRKFHTVVIDEAGQALEPACWIPVLKAKKLVMAGDHHQLAPTVKSEQAAKDGLSHTLMEKNVQLHPDAVALLEEQYRMNSAIMGYSSAVFYQSRLTAHQSVADHVLFESDNPLVFIDTAGCGFEEKVDGTSTYNPEEAAFLFTHLRQMIPLLETHYAQGEFPTIGIISPYKQQVDTLKSLLLQSPDLQVYGDRITVNTIDSFQGQERDMIYISMTRSNPENRIGFLSDIRRMNVAMTRARKKLVVIGDSGTLARLPFYADFITYAERLNAYESAWGYMG